MENLQTEKFNLLGEIEEVTVVLSKTETMLEERNIALNDKDSKLKAIEIALEQKSGDLSSAEERLDSLQTEKFDFLVKMEELEKTIDTEQIKMDAVIKTKSKLEHEVDALKEHVSNVECQVKSREEEIENLTNDMESQRKFHLDKDAELICARDRISTLENKNAALKENSSQEIAHLKMTVDEKSRMLKTAEMNIQLMSQDSSRKEEEAAKNLDTAGNEIGKLKVEISESKDDFEEYKMIHEKQISEKEKDIAGYVSIIQNMETKRDIYEKNLKVVELGYEVKEKEFIGLESKLDKLEKEKAEMKEELSSQIEFLQSQFEEGHHCKDEMKMEIESLKNKNMTSLVEKVEFQAKLDDIAKQLQDQTDARNFLEKNLEESKLNIVELTDSVSSLKEGKSKLEEELMNTKKSKDDIAAALSQFITNTNEVKESASKLDRENQRLKEEADAVQAELNLVREAKDTLELKNLENSNCLKEYESLAVVKVAHEAEIEKLKRTLATEEIKFTDYEQTSALKEENKIKEALAAQKERYNENHKRILKDQTKKYQEKMTEMFNDNDIRVKKLEEEKLALSTKNENYKEKVRDLEKKFQDNQILDQKEIELYKSKYEKTKELLNNKSTEQATEFESMRAEKRSLESQLKFADAKLREMGSNKQADNGAVMPPRQTGSRESIGGNSSIMRSRPSVPGRARQQVVSANLENLDDSVFKIPGPNTPGRARAGRTVSDSRMNTSFRPPAGSGSLFNCDEEDGEVFSNSYLADVKDGRCELDNSSARMSELARRNSMYPQHLKSAYAVELGSNISVSEDAIRQSRFSLSTNASQLPSPSSKLSQLSLDSPSQSTRSKKSNIPPPTSFTLDNENFRKKPGSAVRSCSSNSVTSTTSTSTK